MRPRLFRYTRVTLLKDALDALTDNGVPLAGGQSLIPLMKARQFAPEHLVDINPLSELKGIRFQDGRLAIGALTRHRELETSDLIHTHLPALSIAASKIADIQVRNRGTIGGNVCFADMRANLPPVLVSFDAIAIIQARDGQRRIPLEDLFAGFRRTTIKPGELLTAFEIPLHDQSVKSYYRELSLQQNGLPIVNVAIAIAGNPVQTVRICLGGLAETPLRARQIERFLMGQSLNDKVAEEAARLLLQEAIHPLSDVHASAAYRIRAAQVLLKRVFMMVTAQQRD